MDFINTVLGTPLGYIIYIAYRVTGSYGLAIIIFAIIVKIVLFPIMILAHKNSIRLLQLQPALNAIKNRFTGDKDGLNEAQHQLFTKERYNPLLGIVPLFMQLLLIMGMLQVMYRPLQHILRLDVSVIAVLEQTLYTLGIESGFAPQLAIMEAFPLNRETFHVVLDGFANGDYIFRTIDATNMHFLGLNLGITPSFLHPSLELIIILFSGVAAFSFCLVQNYISPGALSQSGRTNKGLTIFTVGLSLYFAWALPVGVGLYWTVGNFTAIGVVILLNVLYPPKKLAADALVHLQAIRKTPEQLQEEKRIKKELRVREKIDAACFRAAKKQVVFYAISGGHYKYYAEIIDYILDNSDITIHYLTNDPNDALFQHASKGLIPYYAGHTKTISLMLKLEADIMVTTVPDLQNYHIKRSIVQKDIEYVYVFHGFTSMHMVMRPGTLDYYDTVFCVGPHHVKEIRRSEELRNTHKKKLIKAGYGMLDRLLTQYECKRERPNVKPLILIAPSWQSENIMESCINHVLEQLLDCGYKVVIRPHPEYIKAYGIALAKLQEQYMDYVKRDELGFEVDFKESASMYLSDIVITDWSNTAYEFSFTTKRPAIFINTPMKVLNPNYTDLGIEPSDIFLRDKVGVSIDVDKLDELGNLVRDMLKNGEMHKEQIAKTVDEFMYYPRRSGQAGGKYIIDRLAGRLTNITNF